MKLLLNPWLWIIVALDILLYVNYKKWIGKAGEFWVKRELKKLPNDYFIINSKESLEEAIKDKERYVMMDLQNSNLEMYSLKGVKTKEQLNLYTVTYDDKKLMIFLLKTRILKV